MMATNKRVSIKKKSTQKEELPAVDDKRNVNDGSQNELLEITDDLLEEIDKVLEPMGVQLVKDFVQAGGQ
jgi:ubiquitin-like protein Pup